VKLATPQIYIGPVQSPPLQAAEVAARQRSRSAIAAASAVFGLEMTDHRFDGGTPPKLAFDLWRDALTIGRRVVAAISGIGDGAIEREPASFTSAWSRSIIWSRRERNRS
jgi:hypothetical protein